MKKVLFLSMFAMIMKAMSVTARTNQNPLMDEISPGVPTIKNQLAAEQMPFVITSHVQDTDFVVLENELNYDATIESPRSELFVFSSKTTPVVFVRELTSWQNNGNLIQYVQSKRILNLGTHYIEGIATEYQRAIA